MAMDQSLEYFMSKMGRPTQRIEADAATLSLLIPKVPPTLAAYWREVGFSVFKDGLMALVNPLEWQDIADEWLEDTELDALDEFIPIMRGAFGNLKLYGIHRGLRATLGPVTGLFYASKDDEGHFRERGGDFLIRSTFEIQSPNKFDFETESGPLFKDALTKLGPLKPNEIYGFVPALQLGGNPRVENLQKLDAQVHLSILRGLTDVQVVWV